MTAKKRQQQKGSDQTDQPERSASLDRSLAAIHLGECLSPELIVASTDGLLSADEQDTVMAHLAACSSCSAKFTAAQGKVPPDLHPFPSRQPWRWWLAAAIAIAGVVLAVVLVGREPYPQAAPPAVVSTPAPVVVPPSAQITSPATTIAPATLPPPASAAKPAVTPSASPMVKTIAPEPAALPQTVLRLLTAAEAALPASQQVGFAGVSTDDGPTIVIEQPGDGGAVASGFPLVIRFAAAKGATIDLESFYLVCLKEPPVDLSSRLQPYLHSGGLRIQRVSMPAGTYRFRVSLADTLGRAAEREFTVKVANK